MVTMLRDPHLTLGSHSHYAKGPASHTKATTDYVTSGGDDATEAHRNNTI